MRYILVLSMFFSPHSTATALPVRAGWLEIRGMPAVQVHKPASRLLQTAHRLIKGGEGYRTFGISIVSLSLALSTLTYTTTSPELVIGTAFFGFSAVMFVPPLHEARVDRINRLVGQHVIYVEDEGGNPTLRRGLVSGRDHKTGEVVINTGYGEVVIYLKDIKGISVPDHPDLHRQARLLTDTDNPQRLIGEVSEVYDNGYYVIGHEDKPLHKTAESPVQRNMQFLIHAMLPEHEGGGSLSSLARPTNT